jgi:hypothetical protein
LKEILRGLTEHEATTDPSSPDRRLRGRTYAIPFDAVWTVAVSLASGRLAGWTLVSADDREGVIEATARMSSLGITSSIRIDVGLDHNGQTRVDARSVSATRRGDLGHCRRTLGRFFHELDLELRAEPRQILDVTRTPAWLAPG